jgi:hypothetical protein
MTSIDAGLAGHAVTARSAILARQTGLAPIPLRTGRTLRAGFAVDAIFSRGAVFARQSGFATFPLWSSVAWLAILAVPARCTVMTVLAGEAVLAWRSVVS